MNKQALLEDVYNSSFEDELEKIAINWGNVAKKGLSMAEEFAPGVAQQVKNIGGAAVSDAGGLRRRVVAKGMEVAKTIPHHISKAQFSSNPTISSLARHAKGMIDEGKSISRAAKTQKKVRAQRIKGLEI